MNQNALSLKVLEAYTRDVGRGVARIDYDSMDTLNASTGDVIEIKGKRRTVAKCLPLYPLSAQNEGEIIDLLHERGRDAPLAKIKFQNNKISYIPCLLYTSPSPRDRTRSRMPSSA